MLDDKGKLRNHEKNAYGSTVKNLELTFGPKFFPDFPTCIGTPKKNLGENPIFNFSGWPRKSKMRRIVKFRSWETPFAKSGHANP